MSYIDPATGYPEPKSGCKSAWERIYDTNFKRKTTTYIPFSSKLRPAKSAATIQRKRMSEIRINRYLAAAARYKKASETNS